MAAIRDQLNGRDPRAEAFNQLDGVSSKQGLAAGDRDVLGTALVKRLDHHGPLGLGVERAAWIADRARRRLGVPDVVAVAATVIAAGGQLEVEARCEGFSRLSLDAHGRLRTS